MTAGNHPIPLEALDADIAILGKKGRGKTYTAKGIVERLLSMERRVVVLDPLSTWWGLRSAADGESEGFPVAVFGGPNGDLPLTDKMGKPLADVLAGTNLPAVIDLGEMTKAATVRFAKDFLSELYRKNRDPIWLVLEEADLLAPQNPMGDTAAVLGEVDRIARRGRNFGFRLITLTQRPARLHKDVLTQLSTLIAMGVSSPQDRAAIKAWVDGNADGDQAKKVTSTLAKLTVGEGWVWAPEHDILTRTKFPPILTLDTSRTPKVGEKRIEPKRLADVDLSAVQDTLKADTEPKPLGTTKPNREALKRAEQTGFERGILEGEKRGYAKGYSVALAAAQRAVSSLTVKTPSVEQSVNVPLIVEKPPALTPTPDNLKPGAIAMLEEACRRWPAKFSWSSLAALTGRKARGGAFNHARRQLLDRGFVTERENLVIPEPPAYELLSVAVPQTIDLPSLRDAWLEALPNPGNAILETLFNFYPASVSVGELATGLGKKPSGGHWNSGMKALRDNNLIVACGDDLKASDHLFAGGAKP